MAQLCIVCLCCRLCVCSAPVAAFLVRLMLQTFQQNHYKLYALLLQDTALKVSISGTQGSGAKDKLVVAPESSSSITVKVVLPDGKTAASGAQVTLVGVDEALLDLLPYPLQDVNAALQPSLTQSIDVQNFNRLRVAPGAINATYTALRRRLLQLDPFLPADTQIQPSYYSWEPRFWGRGGDVLPSVAAVDIPDVRYLAQYSSPVTPLPYSGICTLGRVCPVSSGFGGGMANMAMEAMPAMAASALPRKSAMMKTLVAAGAGNALLVAAGLSRVAFHQQLVLGMSNV